MPTNRRTFIRRTSSALAAAGIVPFGAATAEGESLGAQSNPCSNLPRQGPKAVVRGKAAVASSQNSIVTQTMLDVLKAGGNAVDACVAGAIVQATVQPEMT